MDTPSIVALTAVIASVVTGFGGVVLNKWYERRSEEQKEKKTLLGIRSIKSRRKRIKVYKTSIQQDKRITCMQLLDMEHPLRIADVYIKLRLIPQSSVSYKDPVVRALEEQRDSHTILDIVQHHLQQRTTSVFSPEESLRTYKHQLIL